MTTKEQRQKQIPFGNDNKKGNSKSKSRSRFPVGMTNKVGWQIHGAG